MKLIEELFYAYTSYEGDDFEGAVYKLIVPFDNLAETIPSLLDRVFDLGRDSGVQPSKEAALRAYKDGLEEGKEIGYKDGADTVGTYYENYLSDPKDVQEAYSKGFKDGKDTLEGTLEDTLQDAYEAGYTDGEGSVS
jgi:hypothetical protein